MRTRRVPGLPQLQPDSRRDESALFNERHRLLLAIASGQVAGYVDLLLPQVASKSTWKAPADTQGILRFLWYDEGCRSVGEALLNAAEQTLRDAGATRVRAFGPGIMPFHKNLSNRLVHIRALFTCAGYAHCGGELYFKWPNFADHALERLQHEAQTPDGVTFTVEEYFWNHARWDPAKKKTPKPSVRIHAIAGSGEKIGICETISSNEYDEASELEDTCFVSWLGVPPDKGKLNSVGYNDRSNPVQGRGLGVIDLLATCYNVALQQFEPFLEFCRCCRRPYWLALCSRCTSGGTSTLVSPRTKRTTGVSFFIAISVSP
eukprot:SAG31_NODE_9430_length_1278_cov_1.425785_1_plen_319_part_00